MSDERALLALAVEAARMSGALLAQRAARGAEAHISSKASPTDLVSEADVASEQAIRRLLAERRPDDGFLGEEGGSAGGSSGLRWIVDPLDGTINFLFGIPQWSVSVAVADARGTLAGAVYDPNRDELFTATRGGEARLERGGVERVLSVPRDRAVPEGEPHAGDLASAMVATGLAYEAQVRAVQGQVLARLAPLVRDIRRFGSAALDLAWTAAGRYDAYFERSVKQWDIAAGLLVCERAGLGTAELPVAGVLPWGVLVARAELVAPLLELVAGA